MAAFYYGSCPWEGLVWKCACDGSDIEIWPFDTLQTNKNIEAIWAIIWDSAGYGGEWRDRILQATIDLKVTILAVYCGSGDISTVSFRQFIKMLHEGVLVAQYTLPYGTVHFFTEDLSREQRIKKFLNITVPYIWKRAQKIKSDQLFDKRMTDSHKLEVIDIIEAVICDLPADEAYAIGNAIKYICRYRNNGKPIQDLEMAKLYINRAIENYRNAGNWK